MKRETAAAALLLLLVGLTVLHLRATDRLIREVEEHFTRAEQAAARGDYELALGELEAGHRLWNGHKSYAQVFFRHPDLDSLQDAFAGAEQLLRQEDPACPAALALLRYHLEALREMEHPSLRSIF